MDGAGFLPATVLPCLQISPPLYVRFCCLGYYLACLTWLPVWVCLPASFRTVPHALKHTTASDFFTLYRIAHCTAPPLRFTARAPPPHSPPHYLPGGFCRYDSFHRILLWMPFSPPPTFALLTRCTTALQHRLPTLILPLTHVLLPLPAHRLFHRGF